MNWVEIIKVFAALALFAVPRHSASHDPNPSGGAAGITDFKDFIEKYPQLYVDKSLFLTEFMYREQKYKAPIVFVAKPPNFGKALLASMADYFFNSKYNRNQTEKLFAGLAIMAPSPEITEFRQEHMNKYPVVRINFASVKAKSYDDVLQQIADIFKQVMVDHAAVVENFKDATLQRIANGTADEECLREFVQILCGYIIDHHHTDPILFVQAYDAPVYLNYNTAFHDKVSDFISWLFELNIINDGYFRYRKTLLTGNALLELDRQRLKNVIPYTNNPTEYNPISEFLGFTDREVLQLIARNRKSDDTYRTLAEHVGGYTFRDFNTTFFNPSAVVRFFDTGALDGGIPASSRATLKALFSDCGLYPLLFVQKLLANESTPRHIDDLTHYPSIKYTSASFWTFLMNFGFTTVDNTTSDAQGVGLKIPNLSVRQLLEELVSANSRVPNYNKLTEDLVNGAFQPAVDAIKSYVSNCGGYVLRDDKYSCKFSFPQHTRLADLMLDLLRGVELRYKTKATLGHRIGIDYIEILPPEGFGVPIRVRIVKTMMLKAKFIQVRNKVCSWVRTVKPNETEILVQYWTDYVDVCLRRFPGPLDTRNPETPA